MQFKYIGDGNQPPEVTNFMGQVKFKLGQTVNVKSEAVIAKLQGNKCFEEIGDPEIWPDKPTEVIDVEDEPVAMENNEINKNCIMKEPIAYTRVELLKQELDKKGIKYHHALGEKKLIALLDAS